MQGTLPSRDSQLLSPVSSPAPCVLTVLAIGYPLSQSTRSGLLSTSCFCVCLQTRGQLQSLLLTVHLGLLLFICAGGTFTHHVECGGHTITLWSEDFPSIVWVPRFPGLGLLSHLTGLTLLSLFFHLGSLTGLELTKQAWLAGQVAPHHPASAGMHHQVCSFIVKIYF